MADESFEFRCAVCDQRLPSGSPGPGWTSAGPCSNCGSTQAVGKVFMHETNATPEDAVSFVGRDAVTGKKILKGHAIGEETKTGEQAGTKAWVEQMTDKSFKPGRYKKKVTLADGSVIKDVDGPLNDQSLHGPQQAATPDEV